MRKREGNSLASLSKFVRRCRLGGLTVEVGIFVSALWRIRGLFPRYLKRSWPTLKLRRRGELLSEQSHESLGGQIGHEKVGIPQARNLRQRLRCQVSAAHRAFHGCGPAGGGPV